MLLRTFVAFTLLMTIACGGTSTPPQSAATEPVAKAEPAQPAKPAASDRTEEFLARIGEFKDQVCACKDSACIDKANNDMMVWAQANLDEINGLTPTKEQDAKAEQYSSEMEACKAKIEEGGSTDATTQADPIDGDAIVKKMGEFKVQVCACKDKACVEATQKQMMEWAMAHMESLKNMKPTKAQDDAASKIEAEMDACEARIK